MPLLMFKKYGVPVLYVVGIVALYFVFNALCEKRVSAKADELTSAYQQAYIKQFEVYREKEQSLQTAVNKLDEQLTKENTDAKKISDRIISDVRSGEQRLFAIPRKGACNNLSKNTQGARMDNAKGRTELDREHAVRILAITNRGDQAIRQLTACQAVIREITSVREQ